MTWFPKACRAARGWLGWSAEDLAKRVGVTWRTIQRIESGGSTTVGRRHQIADVFRAAGVNIGSNGISPLE